jgi:beta-galactosidase/beta-glucuronidase
MRNRTLKGWIILFVQLISMAVIAQWKPAGDNLKSKWTKDVDVNSVLLEYPRPLMVRTQWKNLNGLWKYAVTPNSALKISERFDGEILVPFPVESSLSGVQRKLMPDQLLWYSTEFDLPSDWGKRNIILHFGAIDWQSTIWINDIKIGEHTGGYTPFSFDITPFLNSKGKQKMVIKVYDPSFDRKNKVANDFQPRGKQTLSPAGCWYTAQSGIWQTVWLEPVNKKYIKDVRITSDIDKSMLYVELKTTASKNKDWFEAVILDNGKEITLGKAVVGEIMEVFIPNAKLWSPESPFLYDLKIKLHNNNQIADHVDSYFAMRKISIKKGDREPTRIQLNNKNYFNFGLLDQGWWPDGLYTAPTDEALKSDIEMTKELGFNTIRKHWKIEPARWYYHCDKLGLLVWQDFPGSDDKLDIPPVSGVEMERSPESKRVFFLELTQMIDFLYSYPSIVCWALFNERSGQFKTKEVVEYAKKLDNTRLIDAASGGNHFPVGDMIDYHFYPEPKLYIHDQSSGRATVQGEFGGIGLIIKDHTWKSGESWGYKLAQTKEDLTNRYVGYGEELLKLIDIGISAAIYTQTTDVETECNGMITYDREVMKVDMDRVRKINLKISNSLNIE